MRLIRPLVALVVKTRLLVQLMSHDVNIPRVNPKGQQLLFAPFDRSSSLHFIMFCFETSNCDQGHLNVNLTSGHCETVEFMGEKKTNSTRSTVAKYSFY